MFYLSKMGAMTRPMYIVNFDWSVMERGRKINVWAKIFCTDFFVVFDRSSFTGHLDVAKIL